MGLTPLQYSWLQFADPFAVYVKVDVDWRCGSGIGHYRQPNTMTYIGSTGVSVTLREANRMSVLLKLERGQEAQAELAIRYWHRNSCVQQFTLIKICFLRELPSCLDIGTCTDFPMATETQLSVCTSFLKRTTLGFRPARQQRFASFSRFELRLWRKLHKKLSHSVQPFECAVQRRQASEILYDLSSFVRHCSLEPVSRRASENTRQKSTQENCAASQDNLALPPSKLVLYRFVAWFLFVFCGSIA